jgi:hypothetical protein
MSDIFDDGLGRLPEEAAEAAAAMAALRPTAEDAGRAISASFERAGSSLAKSLTRAAADGKITLDELAAAALRVVETLVEGGFRGGGGPGEGGGAARPGHGLGQAIQSALSSFGGSRAEGGPVTPGAAYLVGERGPEVFRPASAGEVAPLGGGAMTVNVTVERGAEVGLARSEGQIAQALARAVLLGARRV